MSASTRACPACTAPNRPEARYCMRCGKHFTPIETAATRRALAFVERERNGPFFGAVPAALDFSLISLACMDQLMNELWGITGEAPGQADWQPAAPRLQHIMDLGAYLGEVLCRQMPAHWEMDPAQPQNVLGARVVDAQGRRINPCAQVAVRFRDGGGSGMAALFTALTGIAIPPWHPPAAMPAQVSVTPMPPPPAAKADLIDVAAELATAAGHAERGHWGNAITAYRRVLEQEPNHAPVRRQLIAALAHAGALEDALREVAEARSLQGTNSNLADMEAVVLARLGRFDAAIAILGEALRARPGYLPLVRRRSFVLLKAGRLAEAGEALAQFLDHCPDDAEALLGLAHALEQLGQPEAAAIRLQAVLALPIEKRPAAIEAAAQQRLQGVMAKAAVAATPAPAPSAPPVPVRETEATTAYAQAVAFARQGRFDAALPFFTQAAALAPERIAYLKDVGNCLHDLGRLDEARDCLQRVLTVDANYTQARWLLAQVEERGARSAAAIEHYRFILADELADPHYVDRAIKRLQFFNVIPK